MSSLLLNNSRSAIKNSLKPFKTRLNDILQYSEGLHLYYIYLKFLRELIEKYGKILKKSFSLKRNKIIIFQTITIYNL
jgi:hypothetical protein